MSRSMERFGPVTIAVNSFGQIFTVPPGHKYELLELSLGSATNALDAYAVFIAPSGGPALTIDSEPTSVAAQFVKRLTFSSWPLYGGDSLYVYGQSTSSGDAVVSVSIIDVDYSN